jgi:hypothetical protein
MEEPKKVVGLMVQRVMRHGTEYVEVIVMQRQDDFDYPQGVSSWYAYEEKPFLDGLKMQGHIYVWEREKPSFTGSKPAYYNLYCVEASHAKAMCAMLTKIERQVSKDNASESGDLFLAFARAVGAQWVCTPRRDHRVTGGEWSNTKWAWYGLTDGRNLYRHVIAEAVREEVERQEARYKPIEPVATDIAAG